MSSVWVQDKAEAKIRALEAKAEEQRKAREVADAQWQAQQRERELKRRRVGYVSACCSPLTSPPCGESSACWAECRSMAILDCYISGSSHMRHRPEGEFSSTGCMPCLAQEDQEREAEAKALEALRYQKDLEMSLKEAEAEKQRRRAGFRAEQVGLITIIVGFIFIVVVNILEGLEIARL